MTIGKGIKPVYAENTRKVSINTPASRARGAISDNGLSQSETMAELVERAMDKVFITTPELKKL